MIVRVFSAVCSMWKEKEFHAYASKMRTCLLAALVLGLAVNVTAPGPLEAQQTYAPGRLQHAATLATNLPPECPNEQHVTGTEDGGPITVTLSCFDPNGDPLDYVAFLVLYTKGIGPAVGSTMPGGMFTYTPHPNANGTGDFMRYVAFDSYGASSNLGLMIFDIFPVNDPPSFNSLLLNKTIFQGQTKVFDLNTKWVDVESSTPVGCNAASLHPSIVDATIQSGNMLLLEGKSPGTTDVTVQCDDGGDPHNCGTPDSFCDSPQAADHTISVTVDPLGTCADLGITYFRTTPADRQVVKLTNLGASPISIGGCSLAVLDIFDESVARALTLVNTLGPGEHKRIGSAGFPGVNITIPDGALPTGPGGLAVLDRPAPAVGTPVSSLFPDNITGMVYLDQNTVFGISHLRVPAHNDIYDCIYGGHGAGPFSAPFTPVADCLPPRPT